MVVPIHQTKGPFVLMAIVAIAPMAILSGFLFGSGGVQDSKRVAPIFAAPPIPF
jgi:hypothetical protein